MSKPFQPGFLLGASISGHQVDGGQHDQWTAWEAQNAIRLADMAEQRYGWLPGWKSIRKQASDPKNYLSGDGVRHKKYFRQDIALLKSMGLNSLRFGIEWAHLEPVEGEWDETAINFYHEYFAELKRQDITPVVTLWHFAHPQWFEEKGGFAKRRSIRYFERYVSKVIDEYGVYFHYTVTLNEPSTYAGMGYDRRHIWPGRPGSLSHMIRLYLNFIYAHKKTYKIIKSAKPDMRVGISYILTHIRPSRPAHMIDRLNAKLAAWGIDWWFLGRIRRHLDFVGLSFYFTGYVRGLHESNPPAPLNDLGWYMEPSALLHVLEGAWRRYRLPLMVTETGLADSKDKYREWWIRETMQSVAKAQEQGVPILGYMHWSLLDNFEWSDGWWPKFGLISVDRSKPDMPRTIRKSAHTLAQAYKDIS